MPIDIFGKQYYTVAERVKMAHESKELVSITTEFIPAENQVLCKATVTLKDNKVFTGYSAANPNKAIEKMSPYEVSETSAVGRALGFAGFGSAESIATADEMKKAGVKENLTAICPIHNVVMKQFTAKTDGHPFWAHKDEDGKACYGKKTTK